MENLENLKFKVHDDELNENLPEQVFLEENVFAFDEPKDVVEEEVVNEEEEVIENEDTINENYVEEEEVEDTVSIDDNSVLNYLKETLGLDIEDLSDLTKKEKRELPEDVKMYLKYKEETGRGYEDFLESQKDWSQADENILLKKYLAEKNPYFDNDDIEAEIEEKYSFDDDYDSETDIKRITREKKRILADAKAYFTEQNEKYKIPLGSNDDLIPQEFKDAKSKLQEITEERDLVSQTEEKAVNYFRDKTNELFSKDFKGFDFKFEDEEVVFKPTNIDETKNLQMNIANFIDKHLGEDGMIKDVKGYHKALNMAMNPDAVAKHFYELGKAKAIETIANDRKNIDTGFSKTNDGKGNTTTYRVLNPDVPHTFR
jgi:hypothetical protein